MALTNKTLPTLYHIQVFTKVNSDTYDTVINGGDIGKLQYEFEENSAQYPYVTYSFKEWEQAQSNNHRVALSSFEVRQIAPNITWTDIKKGCIYVRNVLDSRTLQLEAPKYGNRKSIKSSILYNDYAFAFLYLDQSDAIHEVICNNCPSVSVRIRPDIGGEYSTSFTATTEIWNQCSLTDMTVKSNFKMFPDFRSARKYLIDDDDSGELEPVGGGGKDTAKRNKEKLYLYADVYRSNTSSRTEATKIESYKVEFEVQRYNDDGTEIEKWNRGVIGFVNDNWDGYRNLGFMQNTATKNLLKITEQGNDIPINNFQWLTGKTTYTENTKDFVDIDPYFFYANIRTNMYIFDTLHHAQQSIEGIEEGIVKMFEGDDLTNTHLNDNDLDFNTDMSDCFVLSQTDVQALARRFNAYVTSSGEIISDLFVGMAMHENPIDCNIDLFEIPINITGFCEVENYVVKFSPRVTPPTPETGGHATE